MIGVCEVKRPGRIVIRGNETTEVIQCVYAVG